MEILFIVVVITICALITAYWQDIVYFFSKYVALPFAKFIYKRMMYKVMSYSLEDLANYTDLSSVEECNLVKLESLKGGNFKDWNMTSIGNLAYLALNHESEEVKNRCKELFAEYKEYVHSDLFIKDHIINKIR